MTDQENYRVELSRDELNSLLECLSDLRRSLADGKLDYHADPAYLAACEIHLKFAKIAYPDSEVTLEDYLNHFSASQI